MKNNRPIKSSIARKFILYIVLFSSFITVATTVIQLYRDYNNDIILIHDEFEQIENVHLGSLTSALWTSNSKLLQTSIDGIQKIRDIQYVEIYDEQKIWVKSGEITGSNNIQRIYPMMYLHRNKDIFIGELKVSVSLDGVYQRLYDTVWVILISNAVKTSLVALFIYFLFYKLVGRHLSFISKFSENHDPFSNNNELRLDRKSNIHDEFDAVVTSINDMHRRLNEQISEIDSQKKYLAQTLDSIGDAVITTDDKGNVTRLNPVAEKLTGWANEEANNQSLKTIFPIVNASTREPIPNPVDRVLDTGETVYLSNHTTLISKNGDEFQIADSAAPIRNDGKILGMVLVFNDVTEQYKVREALRRSEKKLRLIHSQVPGIVYQFKIDSVGKRSLPYVSNSVESIMALTAEEVMNNVERWFDLIHPDDYTGFEKSTQESMSQLSVWEWEGRFIRGDGELVWLSGSSTPERMDDGSTLWNGFFVDVTERMQSAEIIKRSQKMDALGKLTGGIAHDYNNMLGVVLGYADLLKDKLVSQPGLQDYVDQISHAGERGAKLTKKLLDFSRNKSTDVKRLNINEILLDEQHLLEKTLTARIKLELNLSNDLWPVCLDASEVEDMLLNVCINAMHAIKGNGCLMIETENECFNRIDAKALNLEAGDYVKLSIADTGSGMDEVTKEKIFDPFFSTKGEKGTGLGLSQVYGFVTRSGGSIKVDSVLEQGTEFTLYFPRYTGEDVNKHLSEIEGIKNEKVQGVILVVDDEVALLDLTCEILMGHGYQVFRAERAKQALKILQTEHVDLLLSDIIMPEMDGYAFTSIVAKKYPDIKIQLASGFSGNHNIDHAENILSKNILSKPYRTKELLERIHSLLQ